MVLIENQAADVAAFLRVQLQIHFLIPTHLKALYSEEKY